MTGRRSWVEIVAPAIVAGLVVLRAVSSGATTAPPPRTFATALADAKPGEVHTLPDGDSAGPLRIPKGVTLLGGPRARVVSEGVAIVLADGAVLRDVVAVGAPAVQVEGDAHVQLQRVVASGARAAILVGTGAEVRLDDVTATCRAVPEASGGEEQSTAFIASGAVLTVVDSRLGAGCYRAIAASGGSVTVERSTLVADASGVRALDLELSLSDVSITVADPVSGASVYVARSRARLERLVLVGGAHGVLARAGRLIVSDLKASRLTNAALSIVNGFAKAEHLRLTGPFVFAGVSGSDAVGLEVRDLVVHRAGRTGVMAIRTPLVLENATIDGVRCDSDGDLGHGVMALESPLRATGLALDDVEGAAVWVKGADATVDGLDVKRSHAGWVQLGGQVTLRDLVAAPSVGVALVVGGEGRASLSSGRLASEVGSSRCAGSTLTVAREVSVSSPTTSTTCGDADLSQGLRAVVRAPAPARPSRP